MLGDKDREFLLASTRSKKKEDFWMSVPELLSIFSVIWVARTLTFKITTIES